MCFFPSHFDYIFITIIILLWNYCLNSKRIHLIVVIVFIVLQMFFFFCFVGSYWLCHDFDLNQTINILLLLFNKLSFGVIFQSNESAFNLWRVPHYIQLSFEIHSCISISFIFNLKSKKKNPYLFRTWCMIYIEGEFACAGNEVAKIDGTNHLIRNIMKIT